MVITYNAIFFSRRLKFSKDADYFNDFSPFLVRCRTHIEVTILRVSQIGHIDGLDDSNFYQCCQIVQIFQKLLW